MVPREALADSATANSRPYRSPRRAQVADAKREALFKAVEVLASKGIFRASAQQLADLAGVRRQAICRYFGSVDLLYRRVARERWQQVMDLLPESLDWVDQFSAEGNKAMVWLLLVGKPRDLS